MAISAEAVDDLVCADCGCPSKEHVHYEEGSSCGNDGHECRYVPSWVRVELSAANARIAELEIDYARAKKDHHDFVVAWDCATAWLEEARGLLVRLVSTWDDEVVYETQDRARAFIARTANKSSKLGAVINNIPVLAGEVAAKAYEVAPGPAPTQPATSIQSNKLEAQASIEVSPSDAGAERSVESGDTPPHQTTWCDSCDDEITTPYERALRLCRACLREDQGRIE